MKKRGPFYNLVEFGAYDPVNGMRIEFVNLMGAIGSECQNGEKHTLKEPFIKRKKFIRGSQKRTSVGLGGWWAVGRLVTLHLGALTFAKYLPT
jgi:hypothetical protein